MPTLLLVYDSLEGMYNAPLTFVSPVDNPGAFVGGKQILIEWMRGSCSNTNLVNSDNRIISTGQLKSTR